MTARRVDRLRQRRGRKTRWTCEKLRREGGGSSSCHWNPHLSAARFVLQLSELKPVLSPTSLGRPLQRRRPIIWRLPASNRACF